jgi:hypothetical protein
MFNIKSSIKMLTPLSLYVRSTSGHIPLRQFVHQNLTDIDNVARKKSVDNFRQFENFISSRGI